MYERATYHLKPSRTDVQEASRLLGHLGSDHDPIIFRGEETCAADLACEIPNLTIDKIQISYWAGRRGRLRLIERGTLAGMIRDRGGASQAEENSRWPIVGGRTRGN
jgi:hypothetical protein